MNEENTENRNKVGRKPKNYKKEFVLDRSQVKFFADLSDEEIGLEMIFNLLEKSNKKSFGREVNFKDLAIAGMSKLTDKDILKVQEITLSKKEKLERQVKDYNSKNNKNLSFEDYFIMREGIKN